MMLSNNYDEKLFSWKTNDKILTLLIKRKLTSKEATKSIRNEAGKNIENDWNISSSNNNNGGSHKKKKKTDGYKDGTNF